LPRGDEDLEKAGIHIRSLGDAGEMLDDQAKVSYQHRLSELREELVVPMSYPKKQTHRRNLEDARILAQLTLSVL
jgi:hypothetical protein